jgi:hypothetical protein
VQNYIDPKSWKSKVEKLSCNFQVLSMRDIFLQKWQPRNNPGRGVDNVRTWTQRVHHTQTLQFLFCDAVDYDFEDGKWNLPFFHMLLRRRLSLFSAEFFAISFHSKNCEKAFSATNEKKIFAFLWTNVVSSNPVHIRRHSKSKSEYHATHTHDPKKLIHHCHWLAWSIETVFVFETGTSVVGICTGLFITVTGLLGRLILSNGVIFAASCNSQANQTQTGGHTRR